MNSCCDPRTRELLSGIHAPQVVGIPPINAFRDLMQLPDGELRHYGLRRLDDGTSRFIYLASRDCGLSWQEFTAPHKCPGACVQSPWSGDWIALIDAHFMKTDLSLHETPIGFSEGLILCRSNNGPDGIFEFTKISSDNYIMVKMGRHPVPMRSKQRWLFPCHRGYPDGINRIVVLRSDDDGKTWDEAVLQDVPPHTISGHHRGLRWQNYACEPTLVELSNGIVWMLMRTSQDCHYQSFSYDAGQTWSKPEPSRFFGTITMPTLFRLSDGRIITFWCNTIPLPELDHSLQPGLQKWEREGYAEDVFTNRDAFHAAISEDDGKTWIGFRELLLNERRNDCDFRTSGGNRDSHDKSIHQSQAIELPEGKVLVSVGQHSLCRRMLIFDPKWLYESSRSDDFTQGVSDWSLQLYVKGIVGNIKNAASGHCAYNRRPGAQLIPDPVSNQREVLQVARHHDPRLVEDTQGAVWNFPSAHSGCLTVDLRMPAGSQGFRICLMDRWFNPSDITAHESAIFQFSVDCSGKISGTPFRLPSDIWHEISISWSDSQKNPAMLILNNQASSLPLISPSLNGVSYLHIQTLAQIPDFSGVLIKCVAMHAT